MKRYDEKILGKLLDKYERSLLYSGKNQINRTIFITIQKSILPEYFDESAMQFDIIHEQLEQLEESIRFLTQGHVDYEFRTTVVAQLHDEESILQMGEWVKTLARGERIRRWFVQPFADRDTVLFGNLSAPETDVTQTFARILEPFADSVTIRNP